MPLTPEELEVIKDVSLVGVGGLIVFLTSIGIDLYRGYREKKELRDKIKEELQFDKEEIAEHLQAENFDGKAYADAVYSALSPDLVRKLDVKTFWIIQKTYTKIRNLSVPSTKDKYQSALKAIEKTLRLLG